MMGRFLACLTAGTYLLACGHALTMPSFAVTDLEVRELGLSETHIRWWKELEECAGVGGELDELRFLEVLAPLTDSGQQFPCFSDGRFCSGAWEPPRTIFVASGMTESERTVKHEMLHALLKSPAHGPEFLACTVR